MISKCPEEKLLQRFLDDELRDERERKLISEHLKECEACTQIIKVWERHGSLLREALVVSKDLEFASRVEGKFASRRRVRFLRPVFTSAVAVAASVVIVFSFLFWAKPGGLETESVLITYEEADEYFGFQEAYDELYGEENEGGKS
ncbi:anti-sigma factor family protein [Bdellovibrionota bacterium]